MFSFAGQVLPLRDTPRLLEVALTKDTPDRAKKATGQGAPKATGQGAPKQTEPEEKTEKFGASVGRTLRDAREKTGQSLRDVSGILRIRHVYLDAIEQGDFAALPGDAYAYGFIRTYCDHLDLDQNEIVRRFKKEAEHYGEKKALSFPHPVSEGKIPGFAVFFIAGVCLILAYGGWFAWQSSWFGFSNLVSFSDPEPEPSADQAVVPDHQAEETPAEDPPVEAVPDSAPMPDPVGNASDEPAPEPVVPEFVVSEPVESVVDEQPPVAPEDSQDDNTQDEAPQDVVSGPDSIVLSDTDIIAPQAEISPQAVQPPTPPQHFGVAVSRVVLRAQMDSWVQVDTAEGDILFGRGLRAGDSYGVPRRDGLTMKIGNAGGLVIAIDGQDQPTLGKQGGVVSGVPLDPLALQRFIVARNGN